MSTPSALANVLFGRTRSGVLALLYGRPERSFYLRQIARELQASAGAVQRELESLTKVGLLVRTSVGNQVFYKANVETPVFPEIYALVSKTIGVLGTLQFALEPLSKRIVVAFVYGSMARGEEKASSDIDLLVLGKAKLEEVLAQLSSVEKRIGRTVNPTVYSVPEFKSKLASGNHFLTSVLQTKKAFIIGGENELREVGGIRLAQTRTDQPR